MFVVYFCLCVEAAIQFEKDVISKVMATERVELARVKEALSIAEETIASLQSSQGDETARLQAELEEGRLTALTKKKEKKLLHDRPKQTKRKRQNR